MAGGLQNTTAKEEERVRRVIYRNIGSGTVEVWSQGLKQGDQIKSNILEPSPTASETNNDSNLQVHILRLV